MNVMDNGRTLEDALKALKAFNNAITTSRLYPVTSPHVTNAVEKAYQTIKAYARSHGQLSLAKSEQGVLVCGRVVGEEHEEEIAGMVIYRHLDLLRLDGIVLRPTFDRKIFQSILTVFTARKEKINREGGGRPFVDSLGLEQYFPAEGVATGARPDRRPDSAEGGRLAPTQVSEELVNDLLGKPDPYHRSEELHDYLSSGDRAAELIVAGISTSLETLAKQEHGSLSARSSSLSRFLRRINDSLPEKLQATAIENAAVTVMKDGTGQLLARLYCQYFPDGIGQQLFEALVERAPNNLFDAAVRQLRQVANSPAETQNGTIAAVTIQQLLATPKGKVHLGREKAQSLLNSGEQERRDKRLSTGIATLLSGNLNGLKSDELLFGLPEEIEKRYASGDREAAEKLVDIIIAAMLGGDDGLRGRLVSSLVMVGSQGLERNRWEQLGKMTGALLSWVRDSDEGDAVYERAAVLLHAIMIRAFEERNTARIEQILPVFHRIRTDQLHKAPPIPALIGRIQDRSYPRQLFESLLKRYLGDGEQKAGEQLSMMGRPAGSFMIDKLLLEEEPQDRLRIIELLTRMGIIILEVVVGKLQEPMPWYGRRNLIKLVTELGGPEQVGDILPFLKHEDLRVQREAFICIYTISGDQRKQALLASLKTAGEGLLVQIVKALQRFIDPETEEHLATMLADQEHYSETVREQLVKELIKGLARSTTEAARLALQSFVDARNKKTNRKLEPQVWTDAEQAIKAISAELRRNAAAESGAPAAPESGAEASDSAARRVQAIPGTDQVRDLIDQGKQELARDAILKLIAREAARRRFDQAELLREWLIEFDPMALSEIIRAAELIEEEKISAIDKEHIEAWSGLHDALTTEEFATFFHAMQRKFFENEQFIVRQGDMQSGLYFINSGKVRVSYRDQSGEILVKTSGRGEILGADTAFEASVWTVSVSCLVRTEILYLGSGTISRWHEEYPSLASKLQDYCMKSASLQSFFKGSGRDRRAARRHKLSGRVTSLLLDSKGRDTGIASKGELSDISTGGVSFFLRISQKKNARLLLGRSARIMLPMEGTVERQIGVLGMIIAVRGHHVMENEYSVHVKFVDELTHSDLQAIIKTGRESSSV